MPVKLRNPPVVETWIEFHAKGSDTENTWPREAARFFNDITPNYPTIELQREETFEVVERAPDNLPRGIKIEGKLRRVRGFDANRRHCVQVGQDALVVDLIRGNEPYEGFRKLLPSAMAHFNRFVEVFRPRSIIRTALHYTDVVRIPHSPSGIGRIEDYFRIGVQVPDEATWIVGRVEVKLTLPLSASPSEPDDELVLGFRRESSGPGVAEHQFRMDWHAICKELDTLSSEVLTQRLERIHGALKQRFRECFTPSTWELFGEETEASKWQC